MLLVFVKQDIICCCLFKSSMQMNSFLIGCVWMSDSTALVRNKIMFLTSSFSLLLLSEYIIYNTVYFHNVKSVSFICLWPWLLSLDVYPSRVDLWPVWFHKSSQTCLCSHCVQITVIMELLRPLERASAISEISTCLWIVQQRLSQQTLSSSRSLPRHMKSCKPAAEICSQTPASTNTWCCWNQRWTQYHIIIIHTPPRAAELMRVKPQRTYCI